MSLQESIVESVKQALQDEGIIDFEVTSKECICEYCSYAPPILRSFTITIKARGVSEEAKITMTDLAKQIFPVKVMMLMMLVWSKLRIAPKAQGFGISVHVDVIRELLEELKKVANAKDADLPAIYADYEKQHRFRFSIN